MRRTVCCVILVLASTGLSRALAESNQALQHHACSCCHRPDQGFLKQYSAKTWQLIVKRMQAHAETSQCSFTDEEAARIIYFLTVLDVDAYYAQKYALQKHAVSQNAAAASPEKAAPVPVVPLADPTAAIGQQEPQPIAPGPNQVLQDTPEVIRSREVRMALLSQESPKSRMILIAKKLGIVGLALLILMVGTGLLRLLVGGWFGMMHVVLGFATLVVLTAHSAVLVYEYGTPHVAWLWCGLFSFCTLIVAQLAGKLGQTRRRFLHIHIVVALITLVLGALHWALI